MTNSTILTLIDIIQTYLPEGEIDWESFEKADEYMNTLGE